MLRPAYLFGSAILAVVAMTQLQATAQAPDHASSAVLERADALSVPRLTIPAQTISGQAINTPTQPQRWIF